MAVDGAAVRAGCRADLHGGLGGREGEFARPVRFGIAPNFSTKMQMRAHHCIQLAQEGKEQALGDALDATV